MEQLVKYVTDKTGLNPEQARSAAQAVVNFLKEKLPPAMASQVDNYVGGNSGSGLGDIGSKLGGMFGKK